MRQPGIWLNTDTDSASLAPGFLPAPESGAHATGPSTMVWVVGAEIHRTGRGGRKQTLLCWGVSNLVQPFGKCQSKFKNVHTHNLVVILYEQVL